MKDFLLWTLIYAMCLLGGWVIGRGLGYLWILLSQ